MPISAGVGPAIANGDPTAVITLVGTTAGRSLVILVRWQSTTLTITSITVSGESNATVHGSPTSSAALTMSHQIASLANITSGGDKTITVTISGAIGGGGVHAWAMEYAGGNTTNWFDASTGATGNSANPSTSLSTVADGCHLISAMSTDGGGDPDGVGSGYTLIDLANVNWWDHGEQDTDFDVGAAGSKTVDYTDGSANWLIVAASFKPGGTIASGPMFR